MKNKNICRRRRKLTRSSITEDEDFNWDSDYCRPGVLKNVNTNQDSGTVTNYSSGSASPVVSAREKTNRLKQSHQKMRSFNIDSKGHIVDCGFRKNLKPLSPSK